MGINLESYPNLISVVIPTYNRRHLLQKAIDSVLTQTYPHFELIVVDDCSTDGTEHFVKSLSDKRISYTKHKQNKHNIDVVWHSCNLCSYKSKQTNDLKFP